MPVDYRQNEDLEQVSMAMQEEKVQLQQEAEKLAQQLQAVLSDKFTRRSNFDADTPIDKTLGYLESIISVRACSSSCLHEAIFQFTASLL